MLTEQTDIGIGLRKTPVSQTNLANLTHATSPRLAPDRAFVRPAIPFQARSPLLKSRFALVFPADS